MKATGISATTDRPLAAVRRNLMRWYRVQGRHALPWRLTRDPYAVLVSEVMLQQTQVDRVLRYYAAWLERWPTFAALAGASPADTIRAWAGLGYNRRALNLHRLAVEITNNHRGKLPDGIPALLKFPGVGRYTAGAITCFAREERVIVTDTNIARVVARLMLGRGSAEGIRPGDLNASAEALLPETGARDHNLALMDLGAVVCSARAPLCGSCPVARHCAWLAAGSPPASIPVRAPAGRFEDTARFARGRIIRALGHTQQTLPELAEALPERHGEQLSRYLAALELEGMVEQLPGGAWALPSTVREG